MVECVQICGSCGTLLFLITTVSHCATHASNCCSICLPACPQSSALPAWLYHVVEVGGKLVLLLMELAGVGSPNNDDHYCGVAG